VVQSLVKLQRGRVFHVFAGTLKISLWLCWFLDVYFVLVKLKFVDPDPAWLWWDLLLCRSWVELGGGAVGSLSVGSLLFFFVFCLL
jgi:hypothetical protein